MNIYQRRRCQNTTGTHQERIRSHGRCSRPRFQDQDCQRHLVCKEGHTEFVRADGMAHMKHPEKSKGNVWQNEGDGLSRVDIWQGYIFFGLDLTPDASDRICFHLVQKGRV